MRILPVKNNNEDKTVIINYFILLNNINLVWPVFLFKSFFASSHPYHQKFRYLNPVRTAQLVGD